MGEDFVVLSRLIKNRILFYFLILIINNSCLQNSSKDSTANLSSVISPNEFYGAVSAVNKISSILISWDLAKNLNVISYRIYRYNSLGALDRIGTVDATVKQFIDGNVFSGQLYSYIVRAVDKNGIEDSNLNKVSSITYAGIQGVTVEGTDRVKVHLTPSVGSINKVRIYGTQTRGGVKTLLATVSPNESVVSISGLKSGMKYKFNVQGFIESLNIEDNNEVVLEATTYSISYGDVNGVGSRYQGFINIKAFGPSLGATIGSRIKQVILNWAPMTQLPSGSSYFIVRTKHKASMNLYEENPCTRSSESSCRVCGPIANTVNGTLVCIDEEVESFPAIYDYAIAAKITNAVGEEWIEELPSQSDRFKVKVPIPPENMVLVHRDAVNYEICYLMGRATDPLNHQRCSYTGLGAVPLNSGSSLKPNESLNLDPNFYDFGYNLFVDRFEVACNWTKASMGGRCFDANPNGDCFGDVDPKNFTTSGDRTSFRGEVGNVYFQTVETGSGYNACYLKTQSGWEVAQYLTTNAERKLMMTNDPLSGHRPPLVRTRQSDANLFCSANSFTGLGSKRLPRLREFRAYAAWPYLPGEVGALPFSVLRNIENGQTPESGHCNSNLSNTIHQGFVDQYLSSNFMDPNHWFTMIDRTPGVAGDGHASNTLTVLFIGSPITEKCVSRYGIQDAIGNVHEFVSDNVGNCTSSGAPHSDIKCYGLSSGLDSGNKDLESVSFDGAMAARWSSYNITTNGGSLALYSSPTMSPYLNVPLGIPYKAAEDNLLVSVMKLMRIGTETLGDWGDTFNIVNTTNLSSDITKKLRMTYVGGAGNSSSPAGRYMTNFTVNHFETNLAIGFRCVLPAE